MCGVRIHACLHTCAPSKRKLSLTQILFLPMAPSRAWETDVELSEGKRWSWGKGAEWDRGTERR